MKAAKIGTFTLMLAVALIIVSCGDEYTADEVDGYVLILKGTTYEVKLNGIKQGSGEYKLTGSTITFYGGPLGGYSGTLSGNKLTLAHATEAGKKLGFTKKSLVSIDGDEIFIPAIIPVIIE